MRSAILLWTCFAIHFCGTLLCAQEPLLDSTPSPSDLSQSPVQLQLSDNPQAQAAPILPGTNTAPQQPIQNTPQANVASLGNNQFSSLSNSPFYASPFAASLGLVSSSGGNLGGYFGSGAHQALLETPEMFGDFRRPGSSLAFDPFAYGSNYSSSHEDDEAQPGVDFPSAGSFSGMRVSENNVALPQDRIWASYHFYNNAFALNSGNLDLDRFILGVEKTFDGGAGSVEVRLPIAGSLDPVDPAGLTAFAGGSWGNLQVILKRVLVATGDRVLAAGVSVEAPTGSQWHALDNSSGSPAQFTLDPTAVYVTPFLGTLRTIDDIWFINSFLQVDIATNGDRLTASLNNGPTQEFFINQPALLLLDFGGGVWLKTPERNKAGFALNTELHFAQALGDDDTFTVDPSGALPNVFVDLNPIRTILNVTNGLHAQIHRDLSVRTAISVPLLNDRIFDTEFMVQVNCGY